MCIEVHTMSHCMSMKFHVEVSEVVVSSWFAPLEVFRFSSTESTESRFYTRETVLWLWNLYTVCQKSMLPGF